MRVLVVGDNGLSRTFIPILDGATFPIASGFNLENIDEGLRNINIGHYDVVINCDDGKWRLGPKERYHNRYSMDTLMQFLRINAHGAARLALECRARGVFLVHLSTGEVFQGKGVNRDYHDPKPDTTYGKTKLMGEIAVRRYQPESLVVRFSDMLYGGEVTSPLTEAYLNNFVRPVRRGGKTYVASTQVPTWAAGTLTHFPSVASLIYAHLRSRIGIGDRPVTGVVHAGPTHAVAQTWWTVLSELDLDRLTVVARHREQARNTSVVPSIGWDTSNTVHYESFDAWLEHFDNAYRHSDVSRVDLDLG